jgi:hypothetical protein
MAKFSVGTAVTTTTPTIAVDAGLPVGTHRFQLEVIDSAGNRSVPAVAVVTVQQVVIPVPPVTPVPGPAIPLPGPVITPVVSGPGHAIVAPKPAAPRSSTHKGRSKRSKPK